MVILNNNNEDEYQDNAEINMIPLIDVMLVLLIIFMIAAPLSVSGIHVNLPTTKVKQTGVKQTPFILTIDKQGKYFIERTHIPKDRLVKRLTAIFDQKQEKAIYIRADRLVRYQAVTNAMAAAKQAGIQKIALLTKDPTKVSIKTKH